VRVNGAGYPARATPDRVPEPWESDQPSVGRGGYQHGLGGWLIEVGNLWPAPHPVQLPA